MGYNKNNWFIDAVERKGWSKKRTAQELGCSNITVLNYYKGGNIPSTKINFIKKVLGVGDTVEDKLDLALAQLKILTDKYETLEEKFEILNKKATHNYITHLDIKKKELNQGKDDKESKPAS